MKMNDALAAVDGQGINLATLDDAVSACIERAQRREGFSLFTLNLDHLVKRRRDAAFRAAYERATFVTADGAPVAQLARRAGARVDRTTGADLVHPLCAAAEEAALPIYLFGSSHATLTRVSELLLRRHPALKIVGYEAPRMGFDPRSLEAERAGAAIAASGARLCFVALGAPKQEFFADRLSRRYSDIGFVCVGAALDFIAGEQTRAPAWLRNVGLEWAWRLAGHPMRLGGRYARCAALLARLVVQQSSRRRRAAPARASV